MLYIRADMNNTIATGHIMRCLSIADAAKSKGQDTVFILSDEQAVELLKRRGYRYEILYTQWDDMDAELPVLIKLIKERRIKNLLIDSYQVTPDYLKHLSEVVKTFYIDDINAFFYPVNGLICYANYWKKFDYPARYKETELYMGLKYAPLRKEFCGCEKKDIKPVVQTLLLMSGGSDPYDILSKILEKLDKNSYDRIDVICGIYNKKYSNLKERYHSNKNIHIQKAVDDIENYMKRADLAVSAGGMTLYELCAVGTPAISYSFTDNQLDNVRTFHQEGIIDYAGDVRWDDTISNIIRFISMYKENAKLRAERSGGMQNLVDGKGAKRIAEIFDNPTALCYSK